ncbi:hypothetical protein AVEN_107670-1 [Araneus ventricosus]|uniref:Uncharacterized protein n=1 Tax=Araneus ventricosus TaxID=182803 RepID=A0A4Y2UXU6_ARAVE|nr:hypothetical protein AVEN_107670-1 [Araneus ventricosus]
MTNLEYQLCWFSIRPVTKLVNPPFRADRRRGVWLAFPLGSYFTFMVEWKTNDPTTPSANSNLGPRCEGRGTTKDLPRLGHRVEARNETRNPPCGGGGLKGGRNSATLNLVSKQTLEHP